MACTACGLLSARIGSPRPSRRASTSSLNVSAPKRRSLVAKASLGEPTHGQGSSSDGVVTTTSTRRGALFGIAAAGALWQSTKPAFAEDGMALERLKASEFSSSGTKETSDTVDMVPEVPVETVPEIDTPKLMKPVPPVRYKGTNWSVICPGSYERKSTEKPRRVYEQRGDCEPNCRDLQAKRTEETPLVARFGSSDDTRDIAVSIRGANTLKLTFLQIKDVTEFGEATEAAPLFIPPDAKLLNVTTRSAPAGTPSGDNVDKAYYTYDFTFGNARVLLTASVESGNVYLLGCTSSLDAWDDSKTGFERAARSFRVGSEPVVLPTTNAIETSDAKDVNLPNKNNKPKETMNCKGPLPMFCSVEAD